MLAHESAGGIRQAGAFSEPEQWRYDWQRSYTREEWLDQLPTSGAMTRLTGQLATVVDGSGPPSTRWAARSRCPT